MTSPYMCLKLQETENAPKKNTKHRGVAIRRNKAITGFFSPVIAFSLYFKEITWRRCSTEKKKYG